MVYPADMLRDAFYNSSETLVERGDNIRFQDIQLQYDFTSHLKRSPLAAAKVYIYMNNIGLLWTANKKGIDPDVIYQLPAPFTFSVGLNLTLK